MCQTYKDMIQELRDKAEFLNKTDYDRNATNSFAVAMRQAANAIERLCIENDCLSEDVTELVRELNKQIWIPVTERLPEHWTSVIVHRKDGGIFMWEYFDTSPTNECWIDDSMNVYSFYDVTHWMPLPEPPKEEHN